MSKKLFIISEIFIYFIFIILDILNINSTYIKYLGIIFCFIYSFNSRNKLFRLSTLFTLIADLFLLVLDSNYELGVTSFIVVQIIYVILLNGLDTNYFKQFLFLRLFILVIGLVILYLTNSLSMLNVLVIIYFSNLFVSAIESFLTKNKLLFIGLSLFVCCDVCVGLHNLNVSNFIYNFATFMMWVFYLPSQVLIVLS